MSNLHENYDLKIIPSKILTPYYITADFFPFKVNSWERILKSCGTPALSSVNP